MYWQINKHQLPRFGGKINPVAVNKKAGIQMVLDTRFFMHLKCVLADQHPLFCAQH